VNDQREPALTIGEIIAATGGQLVRGQSDRFCQGVSTDTRTLSPGNLFIALVGDRFDGHAFIPAAVEGGAIGIVLQKGRDADISLDANAVSLIAVDDTMRALGDIAHFWRIRFSIPVIAVTGSSGKTTTKEMIAVIFSQRKTVLKNRGNFNNLIGLPLTLLEMNAGHNVAVVEMGTNQPGEIARLTDIARPTVGVITNVGSAHLEGLKTLDGVREEKGALFTSMNADGIAAINVDDEAVIRAAKKWKGKTITFGLIHDAFVSATAIREKGEKGVTFTLTIGEGSGEVTMPVLGKHNIYNALAAAACSHACGIGCDDICRGLAAFRQVRGRMELFSLRNGAFLIDDTYNANPSSVREALKTLRDLAGTRDSTLIFGDMLELGDQAEEIHEDIGMVIADTGVGSIILRGKYSHAVAAGAQKKGFVKERIFFFDDSDAVADHMARSIREGEWILVKGSRGMHMEAITAAILRTCAEDIQASETVQ
jgi:UDP-N-acetylmuramoyl-tripeptide--D-alanyl-D-alanine ligase